MMGDLANGGNKLDRKKTMTMNWAGLGDFEDDDDRFFETHDRLSSALSTFDMAGSSSDEEEDEDFDDCRISFSSAVSSLTTASNASRKFRTPAMSPDYDIWMAAPGSISERSRRLLHGMGLVSNKDMVGAVSIRRVVSNAAVVSNGGEDKKKKKNGEVEVDVHGESESHDHDPFPVMLARSRSESQIERFLIVKRRKEEILGKMSKQRLTRTYSTIGATRTRTRI